MRSASLLGQLARLCRSEPTAPKIVFVPRTQIGDAVMRAMARKIGGVAGLVCTTPYRYARTLARSALLDDERLELDGGNRSFLAAALLRDLDRSDRLQGLPAPHRFARMIGGSIQTLRLSSVPAETVTRHADQEGTPATLRAVAACYERYRDVLEERDLFDDADVFLWAIEQVERETAGPLSNTVYAVTDALDLPECAYRFVQSLAAVGRHFVRIGGDVGRAPQRSAAALFADAPVPDAGPDAAAPIEVRRCVRAVGASNEVRAAVRDLILDATPDAEPERDGAPHPGDGLGQVEVAYADSRPYLSLLIDTLDRLDIDTTVATGLPGTFTQTGRLLDRFYEWIANRYDPAILIQLLRSGDLRVDRWMQAQVTAGRIDDAATMTAHEVATVLAERRYEEGRAGYEKALKVAIDDVEDRIETLRTRRSQAASDDDRRTLDRAIEEENETRTRLRLTLEFVKALLRLAGESRSTDASGHGDGATSVKVLAEASRSLIERFGPVDAPDAEEERDRSLEERARQMFYESLGQIDEVPVSYEAPSGRVAALLREWIDHRYVPPQRPQPGAVHLVPLESAGYSGRTHLYVVGADSDTLSVPSVDNGLLRDADRRALSASLEGALPQQASAAEEARWRVDRALQRRSGPVSLYSRVYDVQSGEERYPSSLFLQLEAEAPESSGHRRAGFLPEAGHGAGADFVLDDRESWLAAYAVEATGDGGPTARERIRDTYPWRVDGEKARRARRKAVYTEHDGLLTPRDGDALSILGNPELGVRGRTMSAGRLETLAATPYIYFLRYVLGVQPLDEPALDDEPWMNRLRHGSILHETFAAFMKELEGNPPSPLDRERLRRLLRENVDEYAKRYAPPSEVVRESALRRLWQDALVFLRAEAGREEAFRTIEQELGFGFAAHRRREGDVADIEWSFSDDRTLRLRGRIDRVDRLSDDSLVIWDYKTGSARGYATDDPLNDGKTLQWALYAYALAEARGEPVDRSGYFFTSTKEMGRRLTFDPERARPDVEAILSRLSEMAESGTFPMTPKAPDRSAWRYRGFGRLFPDLRDRARSLREKEWPEDRPVPPGMDG